jgi:hypothetical protein
MPLSFKRQCETSLIYVGHTYGRVWLPRAWIGESCRQTRASVCYTTREACFWQAGVRRNVKYPISRWHSPFVPVMHHQGTKGLTNVHSQVWPRRLCPLIGSRSAVRHWTVRWLPGRNVACRQSAVPLWYAVLLFTFFDVVLCLVKLDILTLIARSPFV